MYVYVCDCFDAKNLRCSVRDTDPLSLKNKTSYTKIPPKNMYNITTAWAVDREFVYIEPPRALPKLLQTLPKLSPEPPRLTQMSTA